MRHFAMRRIEKYYLTLVRGVINIGRGTLDAPLGRSRANRRKMATTTEERGREAVTHYRVIAQNKGMSLCKIKIDTGHNKTADIEDTPVHGAPGPWCRS